MGSIYKRKGRDGKPLRNYSIIWRDATGKRRTESSGTSDKRAAAQILAEKEREVRLILSGAVDPLQERYREEAAKSAREHLNDYLAICKDKEASSGLREKTRHLNWMLEELGIAKLSDFQPDKVDLLLSALSERGKSARTVNLKLECARSFLGWCVRMGRLQSNPLRVVQKRNETVDRRYVRRALTDEEVTSLLERAREQSNGAPLRPLWYLFPLLAGLRMGDMKRLRWRDLDFDARVLTIRGGKARRRVDRLPLHAELVAELLRVRPLTALPMAPVFPHPVSNATRRKDFEAAGIELLNARGEVADLHGLRVTYGTRLALAGVTPAVHQTLMRHSTFELSVKYYVRLGIDVLEERGIDLLPGTQGQAKPGAARDGA